MIDTLIYSNNQLFLIQRNYAFGGFDWAFDENGNLRSDLTEEDLRKFEAFKKKHPQEWEAFVKNGNRDSRTRSSGSSSYGNSSHGSSSNWRDEWDRANEDMKESLRNLNRSRYVSKKALEGAKYGGYIGGGLSLIPAWNAEERVARKLAKRHPNWSKKKIRAIAAAAPYIYVGVGTIGGTVAGYKLAGHRAGKKFDRLYPK
jgi:hypothetical protein